MVSNQEQGRIEGLDGVRALAIIGVLIFHLTPILVPGGFLGVDVFFVVSGFLITTLLIRELRRDEVINLRSFWIRRARRLLPALATVVVVSVSLAYFAGDDLLVNIGRQVLGALTFSNNWLEISAGSSYFNTTAPQLFVNFWSLAVEEQFYLLWPVLFAVLIALTQTGRQRVGIVLGLALISAVLMAVLYTPGQDATRVYYGTDTHAFGLMIGAALAISFAGESWNLLEQTWYRRSRVLLGLGALVGLAALMLSIDPTEPFAYRGGILLACLLTALVLGALPGHANLLHLILRLRPLAWLGERSYGIYLWHWPIILLIAASASPAAPDTPVSWIQRGAALVLTLAISAASYRWIEEPIRRRGFRESGRCIVEAVAAPGALTPPRLALLSTTAVLALFTVAVVSAPDRSQVQIAMEEAAGVVEASGSDSQVAGSEESTVSPDEAAANVPGGLGKEISGFGDSMMYVAAPGLTETFPGMSIDAKSNRQWPAVADVVARALDNATVRDLVVIAAGTNAGVRDPQVVRETLDLLGPDRQVVLVNIYGSSFWVDESNQHLAEIAADYPNVVIADWYNEAKEHPEDLQPDRIHPNMNGMSRYAEVVAAAIEALPDR